MESLLIAFVLLFVLLLGCLWYQSVRGWTPEKVEQALKRSPPPGSDRTEVESWLANVGWYNYDMQAVLQEIGGWSPPQDVPNAVGCIKVEILNPNLGLLDSGTIQIEFYFDHDGKLIKYEKRIYFFSI